uniref:Uncharacterized protein n=1 Tax=Arundo donax TaxID=35708 RepID=A0A0A9DHR1_ARUDO
MLFEVLPPSLFIRDCGSCSLFLNIRDFGYCAVLCCTVLYCARYCIVLYSVIERGISIFSYVCYFCF